MYKLSNIIWGFIIAIDICLIVLFLQGTSEIFIYNNF
jgi:hypothetical protein